MALSATTRRTAIPEPIRPISKAVGANIIIPEPVSVIPKAVEASEAVGAATKKKKDLNSLPSKADVPKMKYGWLKKQSIVDPAVLLAWDLTNSINQDKALSDDLDAWFCTFLASPNANQWQAAMEGG